MATFFTLFGNYSTGDAHTVLTDWDIEVFGNFIGDDPTVKAEASVEGGQVLSMTAESSRYGFAWDVLDSEPDVEVVFKMRIADTADSSQGWRVAFLRGSENPSNFLDSGYFLLLDDNGSLSVRRLVNGSAANIGFASGPISDVTQWHWLRFRIQGTSIKARGWDDGDPEPSTWDIEVTDTEISAGDWSGLDASLVSTFGSPVDEVQFALIGAATDGDMAPTEGGGGGGVSADVTISGGGTVAATGTKAAQVDVDLSGGGAVASTGEKGATDEVSVSGGGQVQTTGAKGAFGDPAVDGAGVVAATGEKASEGDPSVSGGGTVAATGAKGAEAGVSVSGGGAVSVTGTAAEGGEVNVSVSGGGSVSAAGAKAAFGVIPISGGGDAFIAAAKAAFADLLLSGGGSVVVQGQHVLPHALFKRPLRAVAEDTTLRAQVEDTTLKAVVE